MTVIQSHDHSFAELDSLVPHAPVGRRGFIAGSLGAGFAAAVAPTGPLLAQVITTDRTGLTEGMIRIPASGAELPVYRAQPQGRVGLATILVVHEVFGVHEHIQDVARRFAKAGYQAIAPELFFRQPEPGERATAAERFEKVVSKVTDTQVMADLDACADWAAANGGDGKRLAVTGFCWGGRITWMYAAHQPRLRAGVAWYGRLTSATSAVTPTHPHDVAEQLHAPVLGLYGGADQGIPLTTVEEMQLRLDGGTAASKASVFHVYPDAPHAFHADYRPSYRKDAADDGWKRALAWFAEHGVTG
ncbi:MAG: dienelactone hydrolase family protein [Burkholderiaceae bacterium]